MIITKGKKKTIAEIHTAIAECQDAQKEALTLVLKSEQNAPNYHSMQVLVLT